MVFSMTLCRYSREILRRTMRLRRPRRTLFAIKTLVLSSGPGGEWISVEGRTITGRNAFQRYRLFNYLGEHSPYMEQSRKFVQFDSAASGSMETPTTSGPPPFWEPLLDNDQVEPLKKFSWVSNSSARRPKQHQVTSQHFATQEKSPLVISGELSIFSFNQNYH